jgi:iron complex outermembrane receptor protein
MTAGRKQRCVSCGQGWAFVVNRTVAFILRGGRHGASVFMAGSSLLLAPVTATHAEGPAAGSAATPAGETETGTGQGLEEIIVTARRREEVLQDVPATVNAVTPAELQKLNLQNLQDLTGVVPGLTITQTTAGFSDNDTLRGVSFNPVTGTQNPVAFYVNDVFVTNNFVTTSNFDVGQIEVLRGPQGTLRGEPSPAGSLTITTRKPDLEQFGGYLTVTAAQFGNTNENGAVNLPIIQDKLAVRLAGVADDDDFTGVKSINDSVRPYNHTYGERASLRFEPIEQIEANVMYQHLYQHQQSYDEVDGPGAPGGVNPNAPANYNGPAISPFSRLSVDNYPSEFINSQDIVTGQLDWHIQGQQISYVGSYWRFRYNVGDTVIPANQLPGITAANPVPYLALQQETPTSTERTRTHELRIASESPLFGFLDYTAGFFTRDTGNEVFSVQAPSFLPGSFGSPLSPPNPFLYNSLFTLPVVIDAPKTEKEYSEFIHLTFHLPHDTELAIGGRHLDYKSDGFTNGTLLTSGASIALPLPAPACGFIHGQYGVSYPGICNLPASVAIRSTVALPTTTANVSDHPWIYNASLSHKLDKDLLIYVSSGSSWRPPAVTVGVFNAGNDPTIASLLKGQSERSIQFEGGFKWTFLDDRARLNVAYYHQKFENFVYEGLPTFYLSNNGSTTTATTYFFNSSPDAVVNGVDIDSAFRLTRDWTFDLSSSWSNGHLTGSSIPCNPPNGGTTAAAFPPGTSIFLCPSHASTSTAPNFNATAQSEYDVPIPMLTGVNGFIRGLFTFYGRNPHASTIYVTPSYGITNFYAGLRSPSGAWEGALFAKNAFNNEKILKLDFTPITTAVTPTFGSTGYYNVLLTPRQQFGITATYSFGSR